jgi:hypothetical protein
LACHLGRREHHDGPFGKHAEIVADVRHPLGDLLQVGRIVARGDRFLPARKPFDRGCQKRELAAHRVECDCGIMRLVPVRAAHRLKPLRVSDDEERLILATGRYHRRGI